MKHLGLLASLFCALAVTACGEDASTTSTGQGGDDGEGGEGSTTTATTTTTTTSSAEGGGGPGSSVSSGGGAGGDTATSGGGQGGEGAGGQGGGGGEGAGTPTCDEGTPTECAAIWEEATSVRFDEVLLGPPEDMAPFFAAIPKGGDLHQHLSGSVYAETYLEWALDGSFCINTSTFASVSQGQCSGNTAPVPTSGEFYDDIVRAWSMKDFDPSGGVSGHDHFFSTFGKFGAIAGAHRNESLADVAMRAASENLLHVETMFNLGRNIGELSTDIWSGSLQEEDLPGLYDSIVNHPTFAAEVQADVAVVEGAHSQYRGVLGCSGANPPAACDVEMRFVAQVSRTGANDMIFGQLISAFEMASETPYIVAANLSSPEDDTASINNYMLHMAMLDFLHEQYVVNGSSPLEITLHAGELTAEYLPPGSDANTFHIREAIDRGHADRIGHGIDIASEIGTQSILDDMRERNILVEICLSSNVQILEVAGDAHPLGLYLENGVPAALATDDQGVSRSSLAGEYIRAALDQTLSYRQLKAMARSSLEHAFIPGESLWSDLDDVNAVSECEPTVAMGLGDPPHSFCEAYLERNARARMQWELERRFRQFESQQ